jgi:hypothetical protein
MGKKNKKKKERTAQRFTVDLHSETLSSFSFFLKRKEKKIELTRQIRLTRQTRDPCYENLVTK